MVRRRTGRDRGQVPIMARPYCHYLDWHILLGIGALRLRETTVSRLGDCVSAVLDRSGVGVAKACHGPPRPARPHPVPRHRGPDRGGDRRRLGHHRHGACTIRDRLQDPADERRGSAAGCGGRTPTQGTGRCRYPSLPSRCWNPVGRLGGGAPLFPDALGGWRDTSNLSRELREARGSGEFSWGTSHVLRKTCATILDEGNLSARQLGHAKVSMTRTATWVAGSPVAGRRRHSTRP